MGVDGVSSDIVCLCLKTSRVSAVNKEFGAKEPLPHTAQILPQHRSANACLNCHCWAFTTHRHVSELEVGLQSECVIAFNVRIHALDPEFTNNLFDPNYYKYIFSCLQISHTLFSTDISNGCKHHCWNNIIIVTACRNPFTRGVSVMALQVCFAHIHNNCFS